MKIGKREFNQGAQIDEYSIDGTLIDNSDAAVPTEKAVKTYVDTAVQGLSEVQTNSDNIMLNSFRIAVLGDMSYLNMVDGFMDEYEDETGVNTSNSPFAIYDSVERLYTNIDTNTKLLLHFNGAENRVHHMWGNSDYQMGLTNTQFVFGAEAESNSPNDTVAWHGFSNNKYTTPSWDAEVWESAPYLQYKYYEPVVIRSYCITCVDSTSNTYDPASWVFQGSQNGNDWTDIHVVHGATFSPKENTETDMSIGMSISKYYNTDNKKAYLYYRVKVTDRFYQLGSPATPTAAPTIIIHEFQMFEDLNYFALDDSASNHYLMPIRDAMSVTAKSFGETDAYKANSAIFCTQDGYARTYFKRLTPHQNDILIVPELRAGSNADVDTISGNDAVIGGTNFRNAEGRVSASYWNGSYEPWKAFNRKNTAATDGWYSNDTGGYPAWLIWDGHEEKTCTHYLLSCSSADQDGMPNTWSLKGSSGNEVPVLGANWSIMPIMTSNILPFPFEASTSNQNSGTYAAYTAFNGTKAGSHGWITGILTIPSDSAWVKVKLDKPQIVNRYSLTAAQTTSANRAPIEWTFEGSNDNATWTVLDTVTGCTGWTADEEREFIIDIDSGTVAYQYYKWNMTDNDGDPEYYSVQEFELGNVEVEVSSVGSAIPTYEAWTAFNAISNGSYGIEIFRDAATYGCWLTTTFPESKTIAGYDMTAVYTGMTNSPKDWILYGNNDDQAINTKFLGHFEGSDGATSWTSDDLWGRIATFGGSAQIDTAQFKFGSSSLLLNGTTDYVTFPTLGYLDTSYNFGKENFTIDTWVRFSNVTVGNTYQCLVSSYLDNSNYWTFYFEEDNDMLGFIYTKVTDNRININSGASTFVPVIDTWYHVAVIRGWGGVDDRFAFTVDGSLIGTFKTDDSHCGVLRSSILYVGALNTAAYFTAGHMDETRITKGEALWTSNFTAPTSAMTVTLDQLDEQTDQIGWRANERRSYELESGMADEYRFYKLAFSATEAEGTYLYMQHLDLYETPWTMIDSQENVKEAGTENPGMKRWLVEESELYEVESGLQAPYKSYRLDISNPYNPAGNLNIGELMMFTENPGDTAIEAISDFEIGLEDFTMEGWFMWLEAGASVGAAGLFDTGLRGQTGGVTLYHNGSTKLYFCPNNANELNVHWSPTVGRWHHIALVRENGTFRVFADGKKLGLDYQVSDYLRSHHYDGKVGAYNDQSSPFDGYIKEVRYSNTARYYQGMEESGSFNFTPQTTPFVRDTNTKLLIHGYQVDSNMQDYCAYFSESYDFIGIPDNDAFRWGASDFTIETYLKVVEASTQGIYSQGGLTATDGAVRAYTSHNTSFVIEVDAGSYTFNYQLIQGTWYHVAFVRTGNRMRCYVNGIEAGSDAQKGQDCNLDLVDSSTTVLGDIARIGQTFNDNYYWGFMREFRVSDIARYTEDFVPSTTQFTSDANTVLLLHLDEADSLIPPMGGYWHPENMYVNASTENGNTYRAWRCFNYKRRVESLYSWLTDSVNPTGWIEWEMPEAVTAYFYTVGGLSGTTYIPQDWTLYGSNTRPYNQVSLQNYHQSCVPFMQQNTVPGNSRGVATWPDTMANYRYEASASSAGNATNQQAYAAFQYTNIDWYTESTWNTTIEGAWLMFDFTNDDKRVITQYGFECAVVASTPVSWIFQASNDLETWVDLDDKNLLEDRYEDYPSAWVIGDIKYWTVDNSTAYRYYRIYVRQVSTETQTYVSLRHFFLYDGSRGTASHCNSITTSGWYAFNGVRNNSTGWRGDGSSTTGWLQYDFAPGSPKTIVRYDVCSGPTGATTSPQAWTFEGSNSDMEDYAPILNQFDTIALGRYRGAAKATASTTYSTWYPYNAFNHQYDIDGAAGGGWSSTTTTDSWLRIDLDEPFAVQAYTIVAQLGTLTTLPKDWTFEGGTATDALTTMLLHCDGTDGTTVFPDASYNDNQLTAAGSVHNETDEFKFGTASIQFNGTTDYITIPLGLNYAWQDDLNFMGEDFCFEGWFHISTTIDDFCLWGSSLVGCHFDLYSDSEIRIYDSWTPSDFIAFELNSGVLLSNSTWNHIAIARDGNNLRVFVNGSQQDSTKDCGGKAYNHNTTGNHELGAWAEAHFFEGYMDEIRISKGTSRYTSNFSVETSAWTDPVWTVLDTVTGETSWKVHERRKFNFTNAVAYDIYRLNISANDGGATYTRLQELELHKEEESWTTLDTVSGETTWVVDERKQYDFSNSTSYASYRLNISANNGAAYLEVQELELFEEQNWQTIDTVTGETGWTAWENRTYEIPSGSVDSYKYYKFDITQNNGGAYTGLTYFQLIPETHLAQDSSSYNHQARISGQVSRQLHEHWKTSIIEDDSRASQDECHRIYHWGTAKTARTNVTGTGSFYAWGTGDRIVIPYSDDLNMYAVENDGFDYGSIACPDFGRNDTDWTITWWAKTGVDQSSSFVGLNRQQEGIQATYISNNLRCWYDSIAWDYEYRVPLHTWVHYAYVRKDGCLYQFVNGRLSATHDVEYMTMRDAIDTYQNCISQDGNLSYYHLGQMDEVQVIKGEAKWTSDFTPPYEEISISTESMDLVSQSITATSTPTDARLTAFIEPVDSITINTDLKGYVSRDGGTTWSQVTLEDKGFYEGSEKKIYSGQVDISGQPSGTDMEYKYEISGIQTKIHGTGLSWKD